MKLWNKKDSLDKKVEKFTIGNDRKDDLYLAEFDLIASIGHAKMLSKIGILNNKELDSLINELTKILTQVNNGSFLIEEQFEDVHSKIEFTLIKNLGELGKKIHTGRSRNDQVLVATQLFLKSEIKTIKNKIYNLFKTLIKLSNKHKDYLIPGYTHLQVAMPSSFGLWFSSYAESMIDDILYFNVAYEINDQNPLGSSAGYGNSFDLDRSFTTKDLNFKDLKYNVVASQMNRGKVEKSMAIAIGSISNTLSTFCSDICFYMTQELDFISFPENITTGSSIMPHKKNPDVFELIRSKCNSLKTLHNEFTLMSSNLTSGYHRDLQLLKGKTINSINEIKECIELFNYVINKINVKKNILDDDKYKYIFSVENVNSLVKKGKSFRDSYNIVSDQINNSSYVPNKNINHKLKGGINNLCLKEIESKMKKAL